MKSKKIEDLRIFKNLPIFLKKSERININSLTNNCKPKICSINFYQTKVFTPYSHYKPISKIFKIKNESK
jgi:hypothetical protein